MHAAGRGLRLAVQAGSFRSLAASNPLMEELLATANYISQRGKGILASDESNATTGKRLASVGEAPFPLVSPHACMHVKFAVCPSSLQPQCVKCKLRACNSTLTCIGAIAALSGPCVSCSTWLCHPTTRRGQHGDEQARLARGALHSAWAGAVHQRLHHVRGDAVPELRGRHALR